MKCPYLFTMTKIKNIKRPSNFLAAVIFAEGYFKKLINV